MLRAAWAVWTLWNLVTLLQLLAAGLCFAIALVLGVGWEAVRGGRRRAKEEASYRKIHAEWQAELERKWKPSKP